MQHNFVCTILTVADAQLSKGSSFLSLWFWHFNSEPDLVKYQQRQVKNCKGPERPRFLRRSCWAKFDSEIPVSTPPKNKVCECESLIRGEVQILKTKESALSNSSQYFFSFLSWSIWYVRVCSTRYFGRSCFVIDWRLKLLLLYTDTGTRTNGSTSSQLVNDGRSTYFYFYDSLRFFRMPDCPFFASKWMFLEKVIGFVWWCLFKHCRFPLRRFTIHSRRNQKKFFGKDKRKRLLHYREGDRNIWTVERFAVFFL